MPELIENYWPYMLIGLAIGIAVAWFVFVSTRRASVVGEKKDVLDEGAERAGRNQALIDSAPAAPTVSDASDSRPEMATGMTTGGAAMEPEEARAVAPEEASPDGDDLTRIKGLGPKLAALLNSLDVNTYAQIADWNDADIDRVDAQLGRFEGRIRRDNWVEQAKLLSAGDEAAFSSRFGQDG